MFAAVGIGPGKVAVCRTGINPGADEFHSIDVAAIVFQQRSVAVGFFDVELPAGGHAVVAQPCPQLGIAPVTGDDNRYSRWVGQHIAAQHNALVAAQVHFMARVFGVVEVALRAGLRAFKPSAFGGEQRQHIIGKVANAGFIVEGGEGEVAFCSSSIHPSTN